MGTIDGTSWSDVTIDGEPVQEITVDGNIVWTPVEKKNGIEFGIVSSDLTLFDNQWGGSSNNGEIDITGSQFISQDGNVKDITPINNGVAMPDSGYDGDSGFLMYSEENVFNRFSSNPPNSSNADYMIGVRYNNNQWQYTDNNDFHSFNPRNTDILFAEVEFGINSSNLVYAEYIWKDDFTTDRSSNYVKTTHQQRSSPSNGDWNWDTSSGQVYGETTNNCATLHTEPSITSTDSPVSVTVKYDGTSDNDAVGVCIYDSSEDYWYEGTITNNHGNSGLSRRSRGQDPPTLLSGGTDYDVTQSHTFKMTYKNGIIKFYVDGSLSAETNDTISTDGFGLVNGANDPPPYFSSIQINNF